MLRKLDALIILLGFSVIAFAQTPSSPTTVSASPMDVCKAIIDSAKSKNYDGIRRLSTGMKASSAKNKHFAKVEEKFYSHFESLSCGQSLVAGDRAVIETATDTDKRLIPFVKVGETWKFDAQTYRVFYDTREHKTKVK